MMNRTETEILLSMLDKANEMNFFTTDEDTKQQIREGQITENQYIIDLSAHAHVLAELERELYDIYTSIDLNTATGEALDRLGRLVNVARYPAMAARVLLSVDVLFPSGDPVFIPAGTEVLFADAGLRDEGLYFTVEDVTIPVGSQTVSVVAECSELGFRREVRDGVVTGLAGFSALSVTNSARGTSGRNIEEDDSYRERIRGWASSGVVGTRQCITDYLYQYPGLDGFNLVPLYDGVGSLKVVCDTLEENLPQLASDLYENCMSVCDAPPLCVLPLEEVLSSLVLTVTKNASVSSPLSDEELRGAVLGQVYVFVDGGTNRAGQSRAGLVIGEDFNPSQLVSYLLGEFPEVANIVSSESGVISVPSDAVFHVDSVEVVFDA